CLRMVKSVGAWGDTSSGTSGRTTNGLRSKPAQPGTNSLTDQPASCNMFPMTYEDYVAYCESLGQTAMTEEQWMLVSGSSNTCSIRPFWGGYPNARTTRWSKHESHLQTSLDE